MEKEELGKAPWKEGFYRSFKNGQEGEFSRIFNNEFSAGHSGITWKFKLSHGEFDHSDKRGLEASGAKAYNVKMVMGGEDSFAVVDKYEAFAFVDESGEKLTFMDGNYMKWVTDDEEEKKRLEEDMSEPADFPPHGYTPRPNVQGRIIWLSGGTGMGKTTTAKMLQENHGFVNYEGDCFLYGLNPFVGSAPKGQTHFGTKTLRGISDERKKACKDLMEGYMKQLKGEEVPVEVWRTAYKLMCQDILAQRARIGGDWVIGQAVYTREGRHTVVQELGSAVTIYSLETEDPDLQADRLCKRYLEYGSGEASEQTKEETREKLKENTKGYKSVMEDEKQVVKITVTSDMTPDDIIKIIMDN